MRDNRAVADAEDAEETGKLRVRQGEREREERTAERDAVLPDETDQHRRRADKAAYLKEKLAERERSERER